MLFIVSMWDANTEDMELVINYSQLVTIVHIFHGYIYPELKYMCI